MMGYILGLYRDNQWLESVWLSPMTRYSSQCSLAHGSATRLNLPKFPNNSKCSTLARMPGLYPKPENVIVSISFSVLTI